MKGYIKKPAPVVKNISETKTSTSTGTSKGEENTSS
jgi:hypothetical protein